MLHKRSRLRAEEVREVLKEGRFARSTHLQIRYAPTSESLRSAAVAPKAVAKKAVDRNRLRRAIYMALHKAISPTIKGRAVFFVRMVPKEALAPTFAQEIAGLIEKVI